MMPVTETGLRYNHIVREANIIKVIGSQHLVEFSEEIGVSWSIREEWYQSEERAWQEIHAFMDVEK